MMLLSRDNEYRYITILGLLQTVAVMIGVLMVYAMTKPFFEWHSFEKLPRVTRIVRFWGLTLLIVPIAWSMGSILAHAGPKPSWLPSAMLLFGILLLGALIFLFVTAAIGPWIMPI